MHMADHRMGSMHKAADGVQTFPRREDLDKCHVCLRAHVRRIAAGDGITPPTVTGQHLAVDVGFIVQKSKNSKRFQHLEGCDGSTACFLVFDVKSEFMWGITAPGKVFPNEWFDLLLQCIKPASAQDRVA